MDIKATWCLKDVLKMWNQGEKRVNDPNIPLSNNVEKFINYFANQFIAIKRGLRSMLSDFGIDIIFNYMGWHNVFHLKNLTYPKLIIISCKYTNQCRA